MSTEKERARLQRLLGSTANSVHRDPNRTIRNSRSGSDRNAGGNAEKRSAWAVGGNLVTGDENKTVSMQFTFKGPGAHIVQFNFTAPVVVSGVVYAAPAKCEALITWETNGNTVTRRVSVGDGTTVQGTGESVKVIIYDVTLLGTIPPVPADSGRDYKVTTSVGPGTRGSFSNPPVLVEGNQAISIPAGGSQIFLVPDDAGASSVLVSLGSITGVPIAEQEVQVIQAADPTAAFAIQLYDPRAFGFAPIAPGVIAVAVLNHAAFAVGVQVVWGIDG